MTSKNKNERIVTLYECIDEFHAENSEMDENYACVLGASDEKRCSYSKGAVTRQALYACLTCCPDARSNLTKCAGICLACANQCHGDHELIELYTKRDFRCDCPTERFASGHRCLLNKRLKSLQPCNAENVYGQNFQGVYCICHRPYPDPEGTNTDCMLQCAVCEDWFHLKHLETGDLARQIFDLDVGHEMVCGACMLKHDFLQDYTELAVKVFGAEDSSFAEDTAINDNILSEHNEKLHSDLDTSVLESKLAPRSIPIKRKKVQLSEVRAVKRQKFDNVQHQDQTASLQGSRLRVNETDGAHEDVGDAYKAIYNFLLRKAMKELGAVDTPLTGSTVTTCVSVTEDNNDALPDADNIFLSNELKAESMSTKRTANKSTAEPATKRPKLDIEQEQQTEAPNRSHTKGKDDYATDGAYGIASDAYMATHNFLLRLAMKERAAVPDDNDDMHPDVDKIFLSNELIAEPMSTKRTANKSTEEPATKRQKLDIEHEQQTEAPHCSHTKGKDDYATDGAYGIASDAYMAIHNFLLRLAMKKLLAVNDDNDEVHPDLDKIFLSNELIAESNIDIEQEQQTEVPHCSFTKVKDDCETDGAHEFVGNTCMAMYNLLLGIAMKEFGAIDTPSVVGTVPSDAIVNVDNDEVHPDVNKTFLDNDLIAQSFSSQHMEKESTQVPSENLHKTKNIEPEEQQALAPQCRRPKGKGDYRKGATFWENGWREALCQCYECMAMYKTQNVVFMLDPKDSVHSYAEMGKKHFKSSYERVKRAMFSMERRIRKVDVIIKNNPLIERLNKFIKTFRINKKVITEEDVECFLQEIRKDKVIILGEPYE